MMKKSFTISFQVILTGMIISTAFIFVEASGQISHLVDVTNNVFTPAEITIQEGDTVIWTNSEGRHNVNGNQSVFPANPESFGNSVGRDWTFSYVFTIPGTYDYQCDPHVNFNMFGKVHVLETPPDTLTVNFTGMTPHVGQKGSILVYDDDTGEEIERSSGTIDESFSLTIPGIRRGQSYIIEIFADHNGNGYYDAPPMDHAWQLELNDVDGNEVIDFAHNTNFVDIEWEHKAIINLSGMNPHVGQEIYFSLIDTESGEVVDRRSEMVEESFTVELSELMAGRSYRVDFFSDHNDNGYYDAPPTDHAWRHEIPSAAGDDTLDFVHNTDFTDVDWMHRLRVRFSGMTPHVGQMLTMYIIDVFTRQTMDTVVLQEIADADFDLQSYGIFPGMEYVVDFYADHNGNGMYDAPPADHAWRMEAGVSSGDIDLDFMHNTNFTDIESSLGPNVLLAEDGELGSILTDANGFTLYYFTKDALPDTSLCTGGCVTNWPLFYVEEVEPGDGLATEDFATIMHPEGGMQTTYKGWPLYYWKNDLNPGETSGEGVGNVWFVAKPDYSIMLMDGLLIGKDGVTYNGMYEPGEEMVQYFVDENGLSLYIFINDTHNQNNFTKSDFSNDPVWPIYEEELQAVASTLDKSLFGTIDVFGHQQLTYNGWPLYYYGSDSLRGDATGVSVPSPGVWPVGVQDLEAAPEVTAVENLESISGLQIYPNPAIDVLNIWSIEEIESISIISVTGATLKRVSDIRTNKYELSLDRIETGVYLIEVISTDNKVQISRLLKQ